MVGTESPIAGPGWRAGKWPVGADLISKAGGGLIGALSLGLPEF